MLHVSYEAAKYGNSEPLDPGQVLGRAVMHLGQAGIASEVLEDGTVIINFERDGYLVTDLGAITDDGER